jgi:hypothetical protein
VNGGWRDATGFVVIALSMTALGHQLLPRTWRSSTTSAQWALAAAVAFGAVFLANESDLLRVVHEDVFNRVGGEFDEFSTWLVAIAGAVLAVGLSRIVMRKRA